MKYQALYRKYRPRTFDDVFGQEIIVQTLKNIIKNNKLTHAYLFIGPRGTGKTSIAKIFAKTINCLNQNEGISCEKCDICNNINNNENVDIIEMDAASNNGVDEIREIKNHVTLLPTVSKYKVYIIDEVHMLTTGAFNALLKTLEEPPKHVIFILATTEPHKIPLTIVSRCQSFEFKPIPNQIIKDRLKDICSKEKIQIDDKSLDLIALDSKGGLRDAIGLLDQLNAFSNSNIKYDDVLLLNGRISNDDLIELFNNLLSNNLNSVFNIADKIENEGKNFVYISEDLIKILRDDLINHQINNKSIFIEKVGIDKILEIIMLINNSINDMKNSIDKRIIFDILIIKINNILNIKKQTNVCITNNKNDGKIEKNAEKEQKNEIKDEKNNKNVDKQIYEKLMEIRLNNTLSRANKKDFELFKHKIEKLEDEITNLDQLRLINILSDFEIKAASEDGLVLTTNSKNILFDLYDEILSVDKILSKSLNKKIKTCILMLDDWNKKREIYVKKIKNKEKIDIIDEGNIINEINNKMVSNKLGEFDDLLEIGGE